MKAGARQGGDSLELAVPADTDRLKFRLVNADDHQVISLIYGDESAQRFHPDLAKPEGIQAFIDRQLRRYEQFGYGIWITEALSDGRLLGDAGLTWQETDLGEVLEIAYGLVAAERGQGFATEAARACLDFGFRFLGATQIASLVDARNKDSRKVAARLHTRQREFVHPRLGSGCLMYYTKSADYAD